jgi:hypothetical protein
MQFSVKHATAIFAALAIATLLPAWREAGWPANHEGPTFAMRTLIYARHYSWLDLLPIWTSLDAWGFGSPMPVAYHKLFYMIAAPLLLITGSVKAAAVITLTLLLTAGALGIFATMRALGASTLAAAVAGCCLLTASYTVTNWLVRGAMGEVSGAMIGTWVLFYFVKSMSAGRLHVGLGIALGLLWLGHSVLAFYFVLILGSTCLVLALVRLAPWSVFDPRTVWPAVACFACFLVPFLVPLTILGKGYDFSRIIQPPWRPRFQFRPAVSYIWDTAWSAHGRKSFGLTVQLDHPMLVLLIAGIVALIVARGRRAQLAKPVAPFLLVTALCLILQLPITAPIYEVVPGASFIQFPWRLLAIITPALIVAAVYLTDVALPHDARTFVLGAGLAWMLVSCIAFASMPLKRIPIDPPPTTRVTFSFPGLREYEPTAARLLQTLAASIPAQWKQAECSYQIPNGNDEVPEARFDVNCSRTELLPLPLFASPLHLLNIENSPRTRRCLSLPDFPAICGAIVPAGSSVVTVKLPSMASLPRWGWEQATMWR